MFIVATLSACAKKVEPIEITTSPIDIPVLSVPEADRIVVRPVEWIIVSEDNYEQVFEKLKKENNEAVLFAMTEEGYKSLSLNISDLRTHIEQKNAIILSYKRYYEKSQTVMSSAVTVNN